MFRIGEFAQIAQVSGRLLRYYDELGLLSPARIDPTGYRWYSAAQLPRLNRILALKELGLTLEQIGALVDGEIGAEDMRSMLLERRDAAEAARRLEDVRLRQIELRIAQIDAGQEADAHDIVLKSIPAAPYLATSCLCEDIDHAPRVVGKILEEILSKVPAGARERLIIISRTDDPAGQLDLDVGFSLRCMPKKPVLLPSGMRLDIRELPAVETMATLIRKGPAWASHYAFGAIGTWIEANGYELAGACREVFLRTEGPAEPIIEIQFPVRLAA